MPRTCNYWLSLLCCLSLAATARAQQETLTAQGDEWARFDVGSWKLVRLYTENFNREGAIEATSTRDVRSTLVEVDEDDYLLKVESTVDAGGRRFEAEPMYVRRGFRGETNGQRAAVRTLGSAELETSNRRIPTQILEIVLSGKDQRRVRTVHYSPTVPPFVLRQEVSVTNSDGSVKILDALSETIALEMPYKVLSQIKTTSFVQTIERLATGDRKITLEVQCSDVPGGTVAHSARTQDKNGRTVERTTLELLDYEVAAKVGSHPTTTRRRLFRGRRNTRR